MSGIDAPQHSELDYPGAAPSATDRDGFDRGTGTGEPSEQVARWLRLMKAADDAFNARDYDFFLDHRHAPDVKAHVFGMPETIGIPPHRRDTEFFVAAFPDLKVHNDPYDVQFGQGTWSVAMGRLSGTFTGTLTLEGQAIEPTGKSFTTFFTTIAKWQDDLMTEEFVLFDMQDIMRQIGIAP